MLGTDGVSALEQSAKIAYFSSVQMKMPEGPVNSGRGGNNILGKGNSMEEKAMIVKKPETPVAISQSPKPKKKGHKALWITLIVIASILLVILVPVIVIYCLLLDGKTVDVPVKDNYPSDQVLGNVVADGFATTPSGKLQVGLTQDTLNQLIYNAIQPQLQKPVNKVYVQIEDGKYVFYAELDIPMLKTRAKIVTDLAFDDANKALVDRTLYFNIEALKVGSLDVTGIAESYLSKNMDLSSLNATFAQNGISATFDPDRWRIAYPVKAMIADAEKKVSGNEKDLVDALVSTALANDLLAIEPETDSGIQASLDLSGMAQNADRLTKDKDTNVDLTPASQALATLLNAQIVTPGDATLVFQYLVRGWANSGSNTQAIVGNLDLASVGIPDPKAYAGLLPDIGKGFDFKKALVDQLTFDVNHPTAVAKLGEDDLRSLIYQGGFLGYSYPILAQNDSGYRVSYVSIDDAYVNLLDGKLELVFGIDVNGFETYLIADMTKTSYQNHALTLSIDDFYLGNYRLSGEVSDYLVGLFHEAIGTNEYLKIDTANKALVVDFNSAIDSAIASSPEGEAIRPYLSDDVDLIGADLAANGTIDLTIKANLPAGFPGLV